MRRVAISRAGGGLPTCPPAFRLTSHRHTSFGLGALCLCLVRHPAGAPGLRARAGGTAARIARPPASAGCSKAPPPGGGEASVR